MSSLWVVPVFVVSLVLALAYRGRLVSALMMGRPAVFALTVNIVPALGVGFLIVVLATAGSDRAPRIDELPGMVLGAAYVGMYGFVFMLLIPALIATGRRRRVARLFADSRGLRFADEPIAWRAPGRRPSWHLYGRISLAEDAFIATTAVREWQPTSASSFSYRTVAVSRLRGAADRGIVWNKSLTVRPMDRESTEVTIGDRVFLAPAAHAGWWEPILADVAGRGFPALDRVTFVEIDEGTLLVSMVAVLKTVDEYGGLESLLRHLQAMATGAEGRA